MAEETREKFTKEVTPSNTQILDDIKSELSEINKKLDELSKRLLLH